VVRGCAAPHGVARAITPTTTLQHRPILFEPLFIANGAQGVRSLSVLPLPRGATSIRNEAGMAGIEVVSVELQQYQDTLPQWTDALSRCIWQGHPSCATKKVTRREPAGQRLSGRIEFASLGDLVLSKRATTPITSVARSGRRRRRCQHPELRPQWSP
jgi:hypothetical protein